jgi:hypothetical protein
MLPTGNLSLCTRRCTRSTTLAETLHPRSRNKSNLPDSLVLNLHPNLRSDDQGYLKARSRKRETSSAPPLSPSLSSDSRSTNERTSPPPQTAEGCVFHVHTSPDPLPKVTYSARRRDPRVNGSDLYVARIKKDGTGLAKPCGRCVEWCRWAGVKRIFYWDGAKGKWEVVKASADVDVFYQTQADIRIKNGTVSFFTLNAGRTTTDQLSFQVCVMCIVICSVSQMLLFFLSRYVMFRINHTEGQNTKVDVNGLLDRSTLYVNG